MPDLNTLLQAKPKLPFPWPGTLNSAVVSPLPPRTGRCRRSSSVKRRSRSRYPAPENIAALETSFSVLKSFRALRRHRWRLLDLQYVFLAALTMASLWIIETRAPFLKTGAVLAYLLLLLMPATRQFFLPSWPIWVYLLYFFSSKYIPVEVRPHIWVKVLPALENVIYGANLSNILSAHPHPILDVLAWIPYGIGHFILPLICSILLFCFAAPRTLPVYAKSFGWMNILGVTLAIVIPCTPPWYENKYGLAPAHYGMAGSPAGLARIDALFGLDLYTTSFSTAPVPFGAFPSLHAATATLHALFLGHCFPRYRPAFLSYVGWLWWATMYLSHHYAVDLVGGSSIAAVTFFIARARWLPRPQLDKSRRWEYDFIELGEMQKAVDEEYGYDLGLLESRGNRASDEWSLGSYSSGRHSSSLSSSTTDMSPLSPASDLSARTSGDALFASMNQNGQMFEGEAPARESDYTDVVIFR